MINYYTIYDKSLELANPPFFAADDKSAVRVCRNLLVSATDDVITRVSSLCDIRAVGSFDEVECKFVPCIPARVVCSLGDIPLPDTDGGTV